MLWDSSKLFLLVLAITALLLVEHVFGLPLWFGFCLWLVGRRRRTWVSFTVVWVVSAVSLAVVYQVPFTPAFLLTLVPLSGFVHRLWWRSQTLAVLGSVIGPMLVLALLTQTVWSWSFFLYTVVSFAGMVVMLNSWLIEHYQSPARTLSIEWRQLERLRTS